MNADRSETSQSAIQPVRPFRYDRPSSWVERHCAWGLYHTYMHYEYLQVHIQKPRETSMFNLHYLLPSCLLLVGEGTWPSLINLTWSRLSFVIASCRGQWYDKYEDGTVPLHITELVYLTSQQYLYVHVHTHLVAHYDKCINSQRSITIAGRVKFNKKKCYCCYSLCLKLATCLHPTMYPSIHPSMQPYIHT